MVDPMARQAGHLLINRRTVTLNPGVNLVDTGLCQTGHGLAPDPSVPERAMIEPLPPLAPWVSNEIILGAQPRWVNGTLEVALINNGQDAVDVAVLFWVPHTGIGPVSVEPYPTADFLPPENDEGPDPTAKV